MTKRNRLNAPAGRRQADNVRQRHKGKKQDHSPQGNIRNDLLPNLRLEERLIASLLPASRRVRKIERRHVAETKISMERFGQVHPILITGKGEIIDGHIRVEAARMAGLEMVPCLVVDHLSPEELRLLRLALNRIQERGTWDLEALKVEFLELRELEIPLNVTGFEVAEIDLVILDDLETTRGAELDPEANHVPEVGTDREPVAREGDFFHLGPHRTFCGDARDPQSYATLLGAEKPVMVFTDPPYNVPINGHVVGKGAIKHPEFVMASGEMSPEAFTAFLRSFLASAAAGLVDGGLLYCCIDWRHLPELQAAIRAVGLTVLNLCVWVKDNAGMGSFYRSQHELVFVLKKGEAPHINNVQLGRFGRSRSNVWHYAGVNSLDPERRAEASLHPTVKPCEMVADVILDATGQGDIILDPFLGSGTTLIAAEKTGRRCRGIELDPRYLDVTVQRWQELTGKEAIHAASGLTFTQLEDLRRTPTPLLPPPSSCGDGNQEASDD
jgi:DNA modification methylase